ncbi:MAG: DUF721 domain-containing protein [Nitrospirota bacterium]|jgi:hypothetical protein
MRTGSFFDSVASILKRVVHRHGIETKLFEHSLHRRWPEIAGDQIAAHTRPDLIRFKKLFLIAENSVWLHQLTFLKPTLIEKINAAAGSPVISDIVLRVGEVSREAREAVRSSTVDGQRQPSNLELQDSAREAAAHIAIVKDPDLRERLTAVMANTLSPRRTDPTSRTDRQRPT